ncbi:hypothetical protein QUF72_12525 [Desulfobacterales bacterium HSG2]|nr:hypothetical protein [Desulfobacterales bacterium HSG2]
MKADKGGTSVNSVDVRQTIDQYLSQLSLERLNIVAEFLAYPTDKESNDATQELLDIPGFIESFERGKKDITEGRVTPLEQLKRKSEA